MRRQHYLLTSQEGMVSPQRLGVKDIDPGAPQMARVEGVDQGLAIDDGATGGVDEQRSPLHPMDLPGADESTAFACQLNVNADHVGARQKFFERNKSHSQAGRPLRRGVK